MAIILIVEDDAFIRELAGMVVDAWGHHTFLADGAEAALQVLRSDQPLDLLFTDIYLHQSVHGGCELAQLAVGLRPGLRVLYTTGNQITDKMKNSFVAGGYYIRKPYTPQQLKTSYDKLLAVQPFHN